MADTAANPEPSVEEGEKVSEGSGPGQNSQTIIMEPEGKEGAENAESEDVPMPPLEKVKSETITVDENDEKREGKTKAEAPQPDAKPDAQPDEDDKNAALFPSPIITTRREQKDSSSYVYTDLRLQTGPTVDLYPLSNYTFDKKAAQLEKSKNHDERLHRMKVNYEKVGRRETVEGVLLAHKHGHPHVLLLEINQTFFKLPGGRLRQDEDGVTGIKRKLFKRMAPIQEHFTPQWEINHLLAEWWRPEFDSLLYPYKPPHISKPKERKRVYLVTLPEKCLFAVPSNYLLRAVPLFELYNNVNRYGAVISNLPQLLSHFNFTIN